MARSATPNARAARPSGCPAASPRQRRGRMPASLGAFLLGIAGIGAGLPCAAAADAEAIVLVVRNHRFEPAEVHVPPNQRVRLVVDNQDGTVEEFESHDLNREKLVPAGTRVPVWVGPLAPGRYAFYGDFNPTTAQGAVVVP